MKEKGGVSWKLPPREMSCQHFAKFSPSENNHVYSIAYCIFLWMFAVSIIRNTNENSKLWKLNLPNI